MDCGARKPLRISEKCNAQDFQNTRKRNKDILNEAGFLHVRACLVIYAFSAMDMVEPHVHQQYYILTITN